MARPEDIKRAVQEGYGKVAQGEGCCTSGGCGCDPGGDARLLRMGYPAGELVNLPQEALSTAAGCGSPITFAELKPGEVVLDLGSGGGLDALLASQRVGPQGKVVGVDLTPEMVELARRNAQKLGVGNVEFLVGDIERLPVQDASADVLLSNCVINLAPDKGAVFREAFRALKPGGRIIVADIVVQGEVPESLRKDMTAWTGCIGGALVREDYLQRIQGSGFVAVEILEERISRGPLPLASITVRAWKPDTV
jgi:arsenite methyltransferase